MRICNVTGITMLTLNLPIYCQCQIHMTERVFLLCRYVTAVNSYTQCQSPRVVFGSKMKTEAVGFRLSTTLYKQHQCFYGAVIDITGLHVLSCKLSASKHARHNVINDLIARVVTLADIPCDKERRVNLEVTESDQME